MNLSGMISESLDPPFKNNSRCQKCQKCLYKKKSAKSSLEEEAVEGGVVTCALWVGARFLSLREVQGQGEISFRSRSTLLIRTLGYVNTVSLPLAFVSLAHSRL